MYRSCIFCSAPLGSNESIERFPVGRSLAFDAAKGRLWAVCGRCARWNLAPIEERWEAVEDAERRFRDTRLRVQSENIGLAKLTDGTRLIRVGKALPGELAVWRYGRMLLRRRTAHAVSIGVGLGMVGAGVGFAVTGAVAGVFGLAVLVQVLTFQDTWRARMQSSSLLPGTGVMVRPYDLKEARFTLTFWNEVSIELPHDDEDDGPVVNGTWNDGLLIPSGQYARMLLRRGMVELNAAGARHDRVSAAVTLLAKSGSADEFLRRAAADRAPLVDRSLDRRARSAGMLAVEMAVHDELERDALDGELSALEAAWRDAEEIAGIADRLPDVEDDPPRLDAER
ncbi:MAG TPA: hypothetical protein VFT45_26325 [Longimicrobium sp.]|nr:hypothetical protein [Longimicrobium sp.]